MREPGKAGELLLVVSRRPRVVRHQRDHRREVTGSEAPQVQVGVAEIGPRGQDPLPVSPAAMQLALDGVDGDERLDTIAAGDADLRVLTRPVGNGFALQVARPLDEVESALSRLVRQLIVVGLVVIALSAVLGLLVARRGLRPVERLAASVEHVGRTRDLAHRIETRAGHGSGKPTAKIIEEAADVYAFLAHFTGLDLGG